MMTPSTALKSAGVIIGYLDLEVPEACILPRISSDKVSRLNLASQSHFDVERGEEIKRGKEKEKRRRTRHKA
jgi:hypothetical protein